jgi:hypothetical protein
MGYPKSFRPANISVPPNKTFRATSNFKYGTALLREGRINTKFIAKFLRFSHAKSSPKRSPVCVLARAVGSGVSVNARQSPVAKSETFRPVPGVTVRRRWSSSGRIDFPAPNCGGPVGRVFRYLYAFDRFTLEVAHTPYVTPRRPARKRPSPTPKNGVTVFCRFLDNGQDDRHQTLWKCQGL